MLSVVWGRFPYPITSKELYDEFMDEYRKRMRRNLDHPLRSGDKISLNKRSSFDFLEDEIYTVNNNSNLAMGHKTKAMQCRARRPRFREPDLARGGVHLVLLKPLHADPRNHHSQVWIVRTSSGGRAVLKIFLSYMCESPDFYDGKMMLFYPEEEQAHREAWAYQQLISLQGDRIPHSYGFYDVCKPIVLIGLPS